MKIKGYESLDEVSDRAKKWYSVSEFKEIMKDPLLVILDTRDPEDFAQGFIKGSINIGLNGNFAQWVGEMISDIKQ